MNEVVKILNTISKEDKVVIGCSGGEDSMCLLHLLLKYLNKENIIVAHVNHNIRSESASELEFVKNYCIDNNVVFESTILPNDKKYNEQELRKMRYDFFESVIKKQKASYLLTAHHGDDLLETILMRIGRGSSLKGYAGIELISEKNGYKILRPLLSISKEEITNYIKENNIPHVFDQSNDSDKYTRNRYRHHIIPELKKENDKIISKCLGYSRELLDYYEYVNAIVIKDIEINGSPVYNLKDFNEKEKLIQRKIIEKLLHYEYGNDIDKINDNHVLEILSIINKDGNSELDLPLNKKIKKEYDKLYFENKNNFKYEINEVFNRYFENENYILEQLSNTSEKSNYVIKLLSSEITLPLRIRTVKDGDKIKVKNLKGHKKVNDILIDSKVPKSKRNMQIVLCDNKDEILWVPGLKKSEFDKSKEEKYDIIIKYSEKVHIKEN